MREVISVHIGQAGCQLGSTLWELYSLETGIDENGRIQADLASEQPDSSHQVFYTATPSGKFIPNAFFVDLEPTVIDGLRTDKRFKNLFKPDHLVNAKEDAANNYARGYYGVGDQALPKSEDGIRKMVENCDNLQGFMSFRSIGGGTGSGFGALLYQHLYENYSSKSLLDLAIYPAPRVATAVVEPYNGILTTHGTMTEVDCVFVAENEALYSMCQKKLDIDLPNYENLNHLMSQAMSSLTASLRFSGPLNVDLNEFQTNLVPYPTVHYPYWAFSPVCNVKNFNHIRTKTYELTRGCFDPDQQMVKCDAGKGNYIACCLLYRGNFVPKEVNQALKQIKENKIVNFVNWSPTGFKIGINTQPPFVVPGSAMGIGSRCVSMAANTTAIIQTWSKINHKFDLMFNKRAFLHWYIAEGMEVEEFKIARENMSVVIKDYDFLETTEGI